MKMNSQVYYLILCQQTESNSFTKQISEIEYHFSNTSNDIINLHLLSNYTFIFKL